MTPDFFPRHLFYCLLDDQPDYLMPQRLMPQPIGQGPLQINPHCWFAWHGPLPAHMAARAHHTDGLYDMPWMVWVDDPATRALLPFWLGPDYAHLLQDMSPGQHLPPELPDEMVQVLRAAQIAVTPDFPAHRRKQWQDAVNVYAPSFMRGYIALPGLLHPFHIAALRRYYRHETRAGRFQLGDAQTPSRYTAHNEPVARFFQHQLTHAISDIARTLVQPSYNYLALYQGGADLERHTDREQCEYTLSLCVDATPEPDAQVAWPLNVVTAEGELRVWQYIGDGLLFRGRYLPHSRDRLAQNYTVSNVLLHYVDLDFPEHLG